MSDKSAIRVVVGTTRPGRIGAQVAEGVVSVARTVHDADIDVLDLEDFALPLLDEPLPAASGQYSQEHTQKLKAAVEAADGLVFVTPEYNGFPAPAVINAIDFLKSEWEGKPVFVVGYGFHAASRSVPMLEQLLTNVGVNLVGEGLGLTTGQDVRDESGRLTDPSAVVSPVKDQLKERIEALEENILSRKVPATDA